MHHTVQDLKRNLARKVNKCKKIKNATKRAKKKMYGRGKKGGRKTKKKR